MKVSFLTFRQTRVCILASLVACILTALLMSYSEDAIHLFILSIGFLLLFYYLYVATYCVYIAESQVVLKNGVRLITRPRTEVWKVEAISGPVYQITFRDQTICRFVYQPSFPFHKDFGRNAVREAMILAQLRGT
ncbi:hypothetical protein GCM10023172_13340 [Hymenobacter ginsengisoli]|uniref:PH domain-containing protein n=1 Tax=Hymenobacter ginsengisoli TaxID=1051626 RepID=A0ABP8Q7J1_9BACT|nr:hypothetical protein [Hymenobacter sp. KCTC 23674]